MAALRQQFTRLSSVRTSNQLNALKNICDHFIDAFQDRTELVTSSQRDAADALDSGDTAAALLKLLDSDDTDIAARACSVLWYVTTSFTTAPATDFRSRAQSGEPSAQTGASKAVAALAKQSGLWGALVRKVVNPPDADLQVPAIKVLTSFLTDTSACRAAAQAGATPALVALLRSPKASTADATASALSWLAHDSHNRAKAQVDAGAAPLLAAACSSRQSEPATSALHLLLDNLMPTAHLPPQQEQQCCSGLLAVLRHSPSVGARSRACSALVLLSRPDGGPSRDAVKRAIISSGVVPVLAAQLQGPYRDGRASAAQLVTNLLLTQDQGLVRDLLAAGAVEAALRVVQDGESPARDKLAAGSMRQPMFLLHASSSRRAAAAGGLLVLTAELGSAVAAEERGFWTSTILVLLPGCGPQQLEQAVSAGLLQQLQGSLRTGNQELQEHSLVLLTQLIKALVPALKAGRHARVAEPLAAQLVSLLQRPADLAECVAPPLIPLVYASRRAARAAAAAGAEAAAVQWQQRLEAPLRLRLAMQLLQVLLQARTQSGSSAAEASAAAAAAAAQEPDVIHGLDPFMAQQLQAYVQGLPSDHAQGSEMQRTAAAEQFFHHSVPQMLQRPSATLSACARCGASSKPSGGALAKCSACKGVAYCSVDCQRKHWKVHKECGKVPDSGLFYVVK